MPTVDLRYSGSISRTINLTHDEVCCRSGRCLCVNGRWSSVHLLPGVWQRQVPDGVLQCPEVAALIKSGLVRVRQTTTGRSAESEKTPEPKAARQRRRAPVAENKE